MELDALVEQFLSDGVKLVAVVGHDCERVEPTPERVSLKQWRSPVHSHWSTQAVMLTWSRSNSSLHPTCYGRLRQPPPAGELQR